MYIIWRFIKDNGEASIQSEDKKKWPIKIVTVWRKKRAYSYYLFSRSEFTFRLQVRSKSLSKSSHPWCHIERRRVFRIYILHKIDWDWVKFGLLKGFMCWVKTNTNLGNILKTSSISFHLNCKWKVQDTSSLYLFHDLKFFLFLGVSKFVQ